MSRRANSSPWGRFVRELLLERQMTMSDLAALLTKRLMSVYHTGSVQARISGAIAKPPIDHTLEAWADCLGLAGNQRERFRRLALLEHIPARSRTLLAELEERLAARDRLIGCLERTVAVLTARIDAMEADSSPVQAIGARKRAQPTGTDKMHACLKRRELAAKSVQPQVLGDGHAMEAAHELLFGVADRAWE